MTFNYVAFQPAFSILCHTMRGETYTLTGDVVSWQTQKAISQPQGTFVINLVARKRGGQTWDELLQPMDYIEIRAHENPRPGTIPVIMRGFVDYVSKSATFAQAGGPSEPRVTIQGRDYSKLLLEWQVLYLYTMNNQLKMSTAAGSALPFGLTYNYGIPSKLMPLPTFFNELNTHLAEPIVKGLHGYNSNVPDWRFAIDLPNWEMTTTPILSYTGSFWNLYAYFASAPFGELFIRDDEAGPTLYARMPPYKTYEGGTPPPASQIPTNITISTSEMQTYTVGRTDNDVYDYFLTWGDAMQGVGLTMPSFATDPNNGVNTLGQSLYGPRPLIIDSTWVNPYSSNGKKNNQNALAQASTLNVWLMNVMSENQFFKMGTFTVAGRHEYQIGQYANVAEWDEEYYIEGVSHNFVYPQLWTTQLQVVRGRPLSGTGTAASTSPNNPSGRFRPMGPTTTSSGGSASTLPMGSGGYRPLP